MTQLEEDRTLALPTTSDIQWWWVEGRGEGVSRISASEQFEKWFAAARKDAREQIVKWLEDQDIAPLHVLDSLHERLDASS